MGYKVIARKSYSTAIGFECVAGATNATAIGWQTNAFGGGSMAIGTWASTSKAYSLAIGMGASASGYYSSAIGAWATYSDGRIKSDQANLLYGLAEVMRMVPKKYFHHIMNIGNEGVEIEDIGKSDIGLIAQEVYEIIPEAV